MGNVYLAEDTRLNRRVALKFLPPAIAQDPHARARFLREAQAASALDHPNVATIYEIGDWEQQLFIAMAFYEGETLRQRLERGPMKVPEAVAILVQLATGLAAAHHAGIVHRDLKPANVMLTRDGQVKILDFGLAKMVSDSALTATMTGPGTVLGTAAYMAPEQAQGAAVDARADVWALGVMAYEMLAGRLPFKAENAATALLSMLTDTPPALDALRPDLPGELAGLVHRALEKSPDRRTLTADTAVSALSSWQTRSSAAAAASGPATSPTAASRRWIVAAAVLVLAIAMPLGWFVRRGAQARWAREQALPEIQRLVEQEQYVAAFALANEAKRYIATDPIWNRLDPIISHPLSVTTTPPGAEMSYRDYASSAGPWTRIGESPVTDVRVPNTFLAWKVEKPGFAMTEDVSSAFTVQLLFTLHEGGTGPPGMVHVTAGDAPYRMNIPGLGHLPAVKLHDFWIDRREVTNGEFKRFVDAGGYRTRAFWQEPFTRDGRPLTFDQAIAQFTDSTGRPGPATWELGTFPEGQDDVPVTGVSWYEAAAFAAYSGKSLPTIYHWSRVADQGFSQIVAPRSNFDGRSIMKAGASGAMNRFGAIDMFGNVKEWCSNRADASKRYILGGAWDEPAYMANDPDARSPFERATNFGFRAVKYAPDESLAGAEAELVAFEARDFGKERPANDQTFNLYRRFYAYDKSDLKAVVESVDESDRDWRRERVSIAAAYGNERLPAYLFVPKSGNPPYQAVLFYPGTDGLYQRSSSLIDTRQFDWIIRSGRAVIYPIYKGTFERASAGLTSDYPNLTISFREHVLAWAKDVSRAIDYLDTRPDIAHDRIAYMGLSWGAAMGPLFVAVEPRFKVGLLILGGFYLQRSAPEVDVFNFASRVNVPVLLLNGRFDFFYPVDTSQLPMFRLFGVPENQKRRVVYDTGHNIPRPDLVRETLDWLDRYLGPAR